MPEIEPGDCNVTPDNCDATPSNNVPPLTTLEQDRVTASQRRVNILWEITQSLIALSVTATGMFVAGTMALRNDPDAAIKAAAGTAFLFLSNTGFLVIGFYFGRTNHQRVGGVGGRDSPYTR